MIILVFLHRFQRNFKKLSFWKISKKIFENFDFQKFLKFFSIFLEKKIFFFEILKISNFFSGMSENPFGFTKSLINFFCSQLPPQLPFPQFLARSGSVQLKRIAQLYKIFPFFWSILGLRITYTLMIFIIFSHDLKIFWDLKK